MQLDPSLLSAIIADPDNDLPRLIAADWWQERGEEERAEFVRLQCELVRIDRKVEVCEFCGTLDWSVHRVPCRVLDLRRRDSRTRSHRWLAGTPLGLTRMKIGRRGVEESRFVFSSWFKRGFVESIGCCLSDWRAHADAICAGYPLRSVDLAAIDDLELVELIQLNGARGARTILSQEYPGIQFSGELLERRQ